MASLRDIKRRIDSVQSTKQITRTMEMVASAKIRRASERVDHATPYALAMEQMLDHLVEQSPSAVHPLLEAREHVGAALIIAVASDRGLAGAFNMSVLRHADHVRRAFEDSGVATSVVACGKKAVGYFAYRNVTLLREFRDLSADPTLEQAREIALLCAEMYMQGQVDEVHLVYNHARNAADQDLMDMTLLPITHDNIERSRSGVGTGEALWQIRAAKRAQKQADEASQRASGIRAGFDFEPDAESVLASLLPGYMETVVFHALLDSAAAEQGARRKAMKAATDNASEMIETLTRVYNRVRQGAITTEITEIVGGAAASEG